MFDGIYDALGSVCVVVSGKYSQHWFLRSCCIGVIPNEISLPAASRSCTLSLVVVGQSSCIST